MHYTRTEGGKPPLVLLPGLTANGLCWSEISHELEAEYSIIMPDLRGHGKSDAPAHGYRYFDHANDVVGLMTCLEISAPILIGHSMGGLVAAVVASQNPTWVRGLVLADPTFLSAQQQQEVWDSDVVNQHQKILDLSVEELAYDIQCRHPQRSPSIVEILARARLETQMSAFEVLTPPNPDFKELVDSFEVPCLLVIGDSGVVSPEMAYELREINPRLQVAQLHAAGHGFIYDQPEQFSGIAKAFIESIN